MSLVSVVGLEPTMFSARVLVSKTNAFQPNFATLTFLELVKGFEPP